MLSTVPTVDWVLLGFGESNQGYTCGSLQLQLVCRAYLASWQEKRAIIRIRTISEGAEKPVPSRTSRGFALRGEQHRLV